MYGNMSFTLILGIILLILGVWKGYEAGLVKGITHLVALIITIITLSLMIMLASSFKAGETRNTIYTIIVMVILGAVYSTIRFLLRSFKFVSKLPILQFTDSFLGIFIGLMWVSIAYMGFIWLATRGNLGPLSRIVIKDIDSSQILTIFNKYNIFL